MFMVAVRIARPRAVEIVTLPEKPLRPGEAKVRLEIGGICGSDLAAYQGSSPMVRYPRVIGHELVGVVVDMEDSNASFDETAAASGGPDHDVSIGSRVVVEPTLPCRRCYPCHLGRYNCCEDLRVLGVHEDGGMAVQFNVPIANLHRVPEGMHPEVAVFAEPLCIALHALHRGRVAAGEKVVVFGAGPIGLLILQAAANHFGTEVAVVDIRQERLRLARELGAVRTINATSGDVVGEISAWAGDDLVPLVIEATGHPQCNADAIRVASYGGRLVLVGWNRGPIQVDTVAAMRKELDILGSRNSRDTFPEALNVLRAGHIDTACMTTHKLSLTSSQHAFDLLEDEAGGALKIVLRPDGH